MNKLILGVSLGMILTVGQYFSWSGSERRPEGMASPLAQPTRQGEALAAVTNALGKKIIGQDAGNSFQQMLPDEINIEDLISGVSFHLNLKTGTGCGRVRTASIPSTDIDLSVVDIFPLSLEESEQLVRVTVGPSDFPDNMVVVPVGDVLLNPENGRAQGSIRLIDAIGGALIDALEINDPDFRDPIDFDCSVPGIIPGTGMNILDPLLDNIKGECIFHSNGVDCRPPEPPQDLDWLTDPALEFRSPKAIDRFFNQLFPCGPGPNGLTVCASSELPPPGRYVFLVAHFHGAIPLNDPDRFYQYAFVFDSDGRPGNNFKPARDFPNDFFSGTDKWYELDYGPDTGWQALVRDARGRRPVEVPSHARFVIFGPEMGVFIPLDEFHANRPTFRVTAFCHEGDFGLQGGFWSADYFPPPGFPLLPVARSDSPIVIDP